MEKSAWSYLFARVDHTRYGIHVYYSTVLLTLTLPLILSFVGGERLRRCGALQKAEARDGGERDEKKWIGAVIN